jgi:hypothetical protein
VAEVKNEQAKAFLDDLAVISAKHGISIGGTGV